MAPKGRRGNRGRARGRGTQLPIRSHEGSQRDQVVAESSDSSTSSLASSQPDKDDSENDKEVTTIEILDQKYLRAKDVAGKSTNKTSGIWKHGYEIIHVETKKSHYYCKLCLDKKDMAYKPLVINGTSTIRHHFRSKHGFDPAISDGVRERETSSTGRMNTTSPGPVEFVLNTILDKFKFLLIQWIVFSHIAFLQIENIYFKRLISLLSPQLAKYLPSRVTFRKWIVAEYEKRKQGLKKDLKKARSNIHISFDLWTSPNCYAMIAIVAHFIDSKGSRQTKLLAIRQLKNEHSGENIAACVLRVIKEYKIRKKVGFFVLDNASSNDVAVDIILHSLYPSMSETARKRRRLRCLAHVTNLVAKAFLLGPKAEETLDELFVARHDSGRLANTWQKHGALGRLQNLIRYIRITPQRRQNFKECQVDSESWREFNKLEVKTLVPSISFSVSLYGSYELTPS